MLIRDSVAAATGLALSLLLGGCAAPGAKFTAPASPAGGANSGWRHASAGSAPNGQALGAALGAAHLPANWWQVFADPALDALEQRTLKANPGVAAASARLLQAQAQFGVTHAQELPSVGVNAGVANTRSSSTTSQGRAFGGHSISGNQYSTGLNFAWEADIWGKLHRLSESARAQVQASVYERDSVLLLLSGQVASTYWQWRGVKQEQAILQRTLASRNESLQLVQKRFQAGLGNELDVARAQVERANAAADLEELVRQANNLEHALAVLCGTTPGADLVSLGVSNPATDSGLPQAPAIPAGLPASLLAQRPDLAQSVANLQAVYGQIGVAQTAFYPSLTLTGNWGYASEDLRRLGQAGSRQFSFGPLALSLPIFDGGRNQANLDLAKARYEEALANHQNRLLTALREVEDALSDSEQKQRQGQTQAQAQQAARRAWQVAQARYEHGVSNYLDVTDAQRSALAAERQAAQISTARLLAATQVARALGGDWHAPQ
jgi:multidrug efflux system outer membrane protein